MLSLFLIIFLVLEVSFLSLLLCLSILCVLLMILCLYFVVRIGFVLWLNKISLSFDFNFLIIVFKVACVMW